MHTHFSATMAIGAFMGVLLLGTLWRLIAANFVDSNSATVSTVGRVMLFQY
jgi:uncharacterized membrane protein